MNKMDKMLESFSGTKKGGEDLLGEELLKVWRGVTERLPHLSRVEIIVPQDDTELSYTGGEFLLPKEDYPDPAIVILPAENSFYERLKETRPLAIKIMAEQLSKRPDDITGVDIKKFIFLHEVGHAHDFISNFENDPQVGRDIAVHTWNELRTEQMQSLPVPGLDPNSLKIETEGMTELFEVMEKYPEIKEEVISRKYHTIQELLDWQEREYRNLPKESFADKFASNYFSVIQ